jgi:hypothetical protein
VEHRSGFLSFKAQQGRRARVPLSIDLLDRQPVSAVHALGCGACRHLDHDLRDSGRKRQWNNSIGSIGQTHKLHARKRAARINPSSASSLTKAPSRASHARFCALYPSAWERRHWRVWSVECAQRASLRIAPRTSSTGSRSGGMGMVRLGLRVRRLNLALVTKLYARVGEDSRPRPTPAIATSARTAPPSRLAARHPSSSDPCGLECEPGGFRASTL